jgi:transcriptional regulator with XRE-family HTH domain
MAQLIHIDPQLVAARVREVREHLKLTQAELADRLQLAPARLAHYETGRRPLPVDVAAQLATLGGVSLDWLYGRTNRKP